MTTAQSFPSQDVWKPQILLGFNYTGREVGGLWSREAFEKLWITKEVQKLLAGEDLPKEQGKMGRQWKFLPWWKQLGK